MLTQLHRHRNAVNAVARDHHETDGVDGQRRARRQYRTLHALLAAFFNKGAQVSKLAEFVTVNGGFRAGGKRLARLCDDHADLTGGNLHPGMFLNRVEQPQAKPHAGHQQVGLIAGFAVEGNRVIIGQPGMGKTFRDKAYFRRRNTNKRRQDNYGSKDNRAESRE